MNVLDNKLQFNDVFGSKGTEANQEITRDLWRHFLEKNGLYDALSKFNTIEQAAIEASRANEFEFKSGVNRSNATSPPVIHNQNSLLQSQMEIKQQRNYSSIDSIQKITANLSQDLVISLNLQMSQPHLEPTLKTSSGDLPKAQQFVDIKSNRWLMHNTLCTLVGTNLEVWLRDPTIKENELANILKVLKGSMRKMALDLVKVTVNGQLVFDTNK